MALENGSTGSSVRLPTTPDAGRSAAPVRSGTGSTRRRTFGCTLEEITRELEAWEASFSDSSAAQDESLSIVEGVAEKGSTSSATPQVYINMAALKRSANAPPGAATSGSGSDAEPKQFLCGQVMNTTADDSLSETSPSVITKFLRGKPSSGILEARQISVLGDEGTLRFPIGVCSFNGGIIVCNNGSDTVVYMTPGSGVGEGEIRNVEGKFKKPSAVVVDGNNNVYIKDDVNIYKYDEQFHLIRALSSTPLRRPYGLSMTRDGCLLTMQDCGDGRGVPLRPCFLKYSTDGQLVKRVPLQLPLRPTSKLRFMDVRGGRACLSDLGSSHLYEVDCESGELLRGLAGPGHHAGQFNWPSGIAYDRDGNILIADSKANRIQVFDSNGLYRTILRCEGRLGMPSDIHLSGDDTLLVANLTSHRVFVYKLQTTASDPRPLSH